MERWLLFLVIPLFLIMLASSSEAANFTEENALHWLTTNININSDKPGETALGLAALDTNGVDVTNQLQQFLQQNLNQECFPKGNCNLRETALTAIAFDALNQPNQDLLEWMNSKEKVANSQGDWLIQIISTGDGTCEVSHEDREVFVTVNESEDQLFLDDERLDWINFKTHLNGQINQPTESIEVDCTDVGGSVIISLLRHIKGAEEFQILQQEETSKTTLELKDVCYGLGNTCEKENTYLSSWALAMADEDLNTLPYLRDNLQKDLDYAILFDITQDERFADALLERQNQAGYWDDRDVFATSVAVFSLRDKTSNQVQNAISWLKSKQEQDGSISRKVLDTASVMFFALQEGVSRRGGGGSGPYCGDQVVNINLGEICDGSADTVAEGATQNCEGLCTINCQCGIKECITNNDCIPPKLCDTKTNMCISPDELISCNADNDCPSTHKCNIILGICELRQQQTSCQSNFDCESQDQICDQERGICVTKPTAEPVCGDGLCSRSSEDEFSCPEDCGAAPEDETGDEGGGGTFIIIIVIILILGGAGFIVYNKFLKQPPSEPETYYREPSKGKKKKKGKSSRPRYEPQPSGNKALEEQIDKSIREAQDLFKRK